MREESTALVESFLAEFADVSSTCREKHEHEQGKRGQINPHTSAEDVWTRYAVSPELCPQHTRISSLVRFLDRETSHIPNVPNPSDERRAPTPPLLECLRLHHEPSCDPYRDTIVRDRWCMDRCPAEARCLNSRNCHRHAQKLITH